MNVIENYSPINISGKDKVIRLTNDFSQVGGLDEIKTELYDTISLSLKCSEIFKNKPPIKLSSGILLFGPPGCGKTLIASSIQKEFKINFLSVKGPELLNKYIGASEASVREVFENAKKMVPCVIFFDEFDSIAPKRGTGSSGITDRIVNQLLCYLDGIESREGVFVIGATSRPDLLDSAVIRPGRLDKMLQCGMPNFEERLKIIKYYLNKAIGGDDKNDYDLNCSISIDTLKEMSKKTEYFSGADLQSIVYNAFLNSVQRAIDSGKDESKIIDDDLFITLKSFKRSLTMKEINFYDKLNNTMLNKENSENIDRVNQAKQIKNERLGLDAIENKKTNEMKTTMY